MAQVGRQLALAESFLQGQITRREFVIKLAALGVSATAIGPLLAACASSSTAAQSGSHPWADDPTKLTGTIKLYKGPFVPDEVQWQEQNIQLFNAIVPNVKIDFVQYDWSTLEAEAQASLASGEHDVIYLPEAHVPRFQVKGGPLEDLHPYLDDPRFQTLRREIPQEVWDRFTAHDGTLGGLPMGDGEQSMLLINLDLFAKAGVDVNSWNSSYDAMTQAATKVRALGPDYWGIIIRENGDANGAWYDWYGYLIRAGGDILNSAWTDQAFNTPEFAQTLQMIQDWHLKQQVSPPFGKYDNQAQRALFLAGKVGIIHDTNTWVGELAAPGSSDAPSFKWNCAKMPPGQKADVIFDQGGMYVMSAKSQNKQAAWEVVKHWSRPWRPYDEATGNNPVVSDWRQMGYFSDSPIMALQEDIDIKYGRPVTKTPLLQQFVAVMTPLFDQVYAGRMAPQAALDQASTAVKGVLAGS